MKMRKRSRVKRKNQVSSSGTAMAGRLPPGSSIQEIMLLGSDVGPAFLNVEVVAVGSARFRLPRLIRESTRLGRVFLIQNIHGGRASSALLINPDVLSERLKVMTRPTRTGAQILENLPFKRRGSPRLRVEIEEDVAPALIVRTRAVR